MDNIRIYDPPEFTPQALEQRDEEYKLETAAEDYVWPEPIDALPGFGEPEAFKTRCKEYNAFIAGAKWGLNQLPDIKVNARNTRKCDIDVLINGVKINEGATGWPHYGN